MSISRCNKLLIFNKLKDARKEILKKEALTPCLSCSAQTCLSLRTKQPHSFCAGLGCTLIYHLGSTDSKKYEAPESHLIVLLPQEACEIGFKLRRSSDTEYSELSDSAFKKFLQPQELETRNER